MATIIQDVDQAPRLCFEGRLADIAGAEPRLRFATIRQGMSLIKASFPEIIKLKDMPIEVRVNGQEVGPKFYDVPLKSGATVVIAPSIRGASEGRDKIVLATVLMIAANSIPGGSVVAGPAFEAATAAEKATTVLYNLGLTIALNGVQMLITGDINTPNDPEERGGGLYSGPKNTAGEGRTIPLLYGYSRVGGVIIQATIDSVIA